MPNSAATTATQSLYDRLGGNAGIEAIVHDIVEAHMANPVIAPRFLPYRETPDTLATVKGHLAKFLAEGTGGPDPYEGRSMPETHRGMNISTAEYIAAVEDIMQTLEAHRIDEETRQAVLAIAWSLKGEIVGQ